MRWVKDFRHVLRGHFIEEFENVYTYALRNSFLGSCKERIWLTYLDAIHLREECDDFVPLVSRYCSGISQYRVGDYHLDGFSELPGGCREFYEFYGCYYHNCDVCHTDRSRAVRCKSREQG